mmetsp:Transcript_21003/g.43404  ORF Transcript_21003/g.43404 Transcript_21003/m.43404 type:complete len:260 (+) Transcript_21003:1371-2150(+)
MNGVQRLLKRGPHSGDAFPQRRSWRRRNRSCFLGSAANGADEMEGIFIQKGARGTVPSPALLDRRRILRLLLLNAQATTSRPARRFGILLDEASRQLRGFDAAPQEHGFLQRHRNLRPEIIPRRPRGARIPEFLGLQPSFLAPLPPPPRFDPPGRSTVVRLRLGQQLRQTLLRPLRVTFLPRLGRRIVGHDFLVVFVGVDAALDAGPAVGAVDGGGVVHGGGGGEVHGGDGGAADEVDGFAQLVPGDAVVVFFAGYGGA